MMVRAKRIFLLAALASAFTSACATDPVTWHCAVSGGVPSDSTRAQAACEHARAVFSRLLGRVAPSVQVQLGDAWATGRSFGRVTRIRMPTLSAYNTGARRTEDAEKRRAEWEDFIAHEVMHLLMGTLPGARPTGPGYGTAYPDWFDEAVAIAAESRDTRMRRLRQARAAVDELPSLDSLLAARHPSQVHRWPKGVERVTVSIINCSKPCRVPGYRSDTTTIVQRRIDGRIRFDTIYGPSPYSSASNNAFYVSAYSFLEFLRMNLGDEVMAELADAYRVEAARTSLPLNAGADLPSMSNAWKDWLRSNQPPKPLN